MCVALISLRSRPPILEQNWRLLLRRSIKKRSAELAVIDPTHGRPVPPKKCRGQSWPRHRSIGKKPTLVLVVLDFAGVALVAVAVLVALVVLVVDIMLVDGDTTGSATAN